MEEKIDITDKTIEIDTDKGSAIKVTMSYGEQSTLEELLIAYLEQIAIYLRLSKEDEFVKMRATVLPISVLLSVDLLIKIRNFAK